MSTKKEEKKLTKAEIQEKAVELAKNLGISKVIPIVFVEAGEDIIGYIKEPTRMQKIAVMDKAMMGGFSAAEEILQHVIIKEHSDPRILSDASEHDAIYIGAVMAVYDQIRYSTNTLKKK